MHVDALPFLARRTPPPLPAPVPFPESSVRPRGVYLGTDAAPGTVVVLVYDHAGRRISRAELAADIYTVATFDAFVAWLDMVDPVEDAPACDAAPRLRLSIPAGA